MHPFLFENQLIKNGINVPVELKMKKIHKKRIFFLFVLKFGTVFVF